MSIVIPAYNAETFLERCLVSVLEQSYGSWELLVIDDGSTDATRRILDVYSRKDRRIFSLHHPVRENLGVARSRGLGISQATGEYIAFLDADDWFEGHKLERQVAALETERECVLSHTAVVVESDEGYRSAAIERHFNGVSAARTIYEFDRREDFMCANPICNSTVMVRTSAAKSIKHSVAQLFQFEDWVLWVFLSEGGQFLFLPERLSRYRDHGRSATRKVRNDPLMELYSQLEFLLCVIANSPNRAHVARAQQVMQFVVGSLLVSYNPSYAGMTNEGVAEALSEEHLLRPFDELRRLKAELLEVREMWLYRVSRGIRAPLRRFLGRTGA